MRDPFSSDYDRGVGTGPAATATDTAAPTTAAPIDRATTATVDTASAVAPEEQRYGLGKPRRIVIRGRIAHE